MTKRCDLMSIRSLIELSSWSGSSHRENLVCFSFSIRRLEALLAWLVLRRIMDMGESLNYLLIVIRINRLIRCWSCLWLLYLSRCLHLDTILVEGFCVMVHGIIERFVQLACWLLVPSFAGLPAIILPWEVLDDIFHDVLLIWLPILLRRMELKPLMYHFLVKFQVFFSRTTFEEACRLVGLSLFGLKMAELELIMYLPQRSWFSFV